MTSGSEDTPGDPPGGWYETAPTPDGRIDSASLFGDAEIILIEHHGETYVLRKTRKGKLILTK
jgi:hemin uptake protein HemP